MSAALLVFFPGYRLAMPLILRRVGPAQRHVHADKLAGDRAGGERVASDDGPLPAAAARACGDAAADRRKEEE